MTKKPDIAERIAMGLVVAVLLYVVIRVGVAHGMADFMNGFM